MKRDDWTIVAIVAAAVAILIAIIVFWTWPAKAQGRGMSACQPPALMAEMLKNRYNEDEIGRGVDAIGRRLIQLFASPDGVTWSILVTHAGQGACLVASGADWDVTSLTRGKEAWLRAQ